MFVPFCSEGVIARAISTGLLSIETVNLREYSNDERRTVDSHPFGGGDGMVLRPDVVGSALDAVCGPESFVVHVSPSGKVFDNDWAKRLALLPHVVFLCGRYAGFDERIIERYVNVSLSVGDFVLSGGELPTLCMMDATARFLPGVLGNETSAASDSFENGLLEAPQFTKPVTYQGMTVPEILFSGDHKRIATHHRREQLRKTARNRPDLINRVWDSLSRSERAYVEKIWRHADSTPK